MNTHVEYRRHRHQPTPEPQSPELSESLAGHLAVSADPSLRSTSPGSTTATAKHVAWVRPTDLHTVASHAIGRGIDLHAELARRTRRSPRQLNRTIHRTLRRTVAPDVPATKGTTQEGLQL